MRPESQAKRDLRRACHGAREQEIGDVRRDEQQQQHCDHCQRAQQGQKHGLATPRRLPNRQHSDARVSICVRILLLEPSHHGAGSGLRPSNTHTRLQPGVGVQEAPVPPAHCLRRVAEFSRHGHRNPEIETEPAHAAVEISRRDAHDGEGTAGDFEHTTEDLRIRAEPSLPQTVAQNDHAVGARMLFFVGQEEPPQRGLHTKHIKEVRCRGFRPNPVRRVAKPQTHGVVTRSRDSGEQIGLGGQITVVQ